MAAGKIDIWYLLLALARRRNRFFERRGHVSICCHHVRRLRHVRLASQPRAYLLAIGHGEAAFATHWHSFTGPAMRRRHRNTKVPRYGGLAFEGAGGGELFFLKLVFHDLIYSTWQRGVWTIHFSLYTPIFVTLRPTKRLSEPCTICAHYGVHQAWIFTDEVS